MKRARSSACRSACTALSKGFGLIDKHYGERLTLATIPPEEPHVYAMIQRADTIGVFQIESRARMSMLPRLKPAKVYDLVIEVAIVRPGPIQGDMVHPYLRRRQGLEEVVYPSQELEAVLKKTLGVPLFQEQAMKIAIVVAGFTPSEADRLRRAMATFRRGGTIQTFEDKMIEGMAAKGYDRDFAERYFRQIEGFGEYGFPESHAASFALLVYASCWMKCRYPDVFAAAMLNSQPLGFYAPAQLVRDAREHSVGVREVDVNLSDWDCTLEPPPSPACGRGVGAEGEGRKPSSVAFSREREKGLTHPRHASMASHIRATHAVRLGLRQIVGVREDDMRRLVERRGEGYDSVRNLWLRSLYPGRHRRRGRSRRAGSQSEGRTGFEQRRGGRCASSRSCKPVFAGQQEAGPKVVYEPKRRPTSGVDAGPRGLGCAAPQTRRLEQPIIGVLDPAHRMEPSEIGPCPAIITTVIEWLHSFASI
jgi:error-prone DNA polymerase